MNSLNREYLVSIIVPTYNGNENLKNVVESIINQSIGFENVELIIVDDASNDKITKEIILEYQSKYPDNIKPIFMNKNSGHPGKPRNIGLKHVTSDYILFADHDDVYLKDAFKILYDALTKYDSDFIIGNVYNNVDGYKFPLINHLKEDIININPRANQENFNMLNNIKVGSWARIYKKEFILENNLIFMENNNFEDYYFNLNLLKYANKVSILPNNIVYTYNIYEDSAIHKHDIDLFNGLIEGAYELSDAIKDFGLNADIFFINFVGPLLLVFSDLNNDQKKESALKLYNLEKYLEKEFNFDFDLRKKELNILNNAIMQKKFKKAIIISNIYITLYRNKYIQRIYKKYRSNSTIKIKKLDKT